MGDYVFHVPRGELKRGAESVKLTERERDLLRLFAQRPGVPIGRNDLAETTPPATSARSTCRSTACAARSRSTPPITSIFRPCAEKAIFCTRIDMLHFPDPVGEWQRFR
jgi:hypothetical protein